MRRKQVTVVRNGVKKRVNLAVVVYEAHYGPVPPGCVVHHIDFNPENDHPLNLIALTRKVHARLHVPFSLRRRSAVSTLHLITEKAI